MLNAFATYARRDAGDGEPRRTDFSLFALSSSKVATRSWYPGQKAFRVPGRSLRCWGHRGDMRFLGGLSAYELP